MNAPSDPADHLIDLRAVRAMAEGCGWTLAEYASFYDEGARAEFLRMEAAVAGGDLAEVERLAHGAKGASGSAGAVGMVGIWGRLEAAARKGEADAFSALIAEAAVRLDAVLAALAALPASEPDA